MDRDTTGQRLTAGWANTVRSRRFMVQPLPPQFCRLTAQKRPPEGAVGRCPAALKRLDSGRRKGGRIVPGTRFGFAFRARLARSCAWPI
jgi:hypothetical protein